MRALPIWGLSALLYSSAVSAEPLQPTSKWEVQYSDVACTAKRQFGDYLLAIQPSPLGKTVRYVIEGPGRMSAAHQFETEILVADGGRPIHTSSLVYLLPAKDRRGMEIILSQDESRRLQSSNEFGISSDLLDSRAVENRVRRNEPMAVQFNASFGGTLSKALDDCMADLRGHWGFVDGKIPTPATPAKIVRGPHLTSYDYPAEALANDQNGRTRYSFMIDEKGRMLDCVIDESSGNASLDRTGCQLMAQRARFQPARDAIGNAVKSIYRFTLDWKITL